MHISKSSEICRRAFMRRTAALSAAGVASSYTLGLSGIADLAAQTQQSGYQALVCVFLYGGNDHANTLIPYDTANYSRYFQLRGGVNGAALSRESLAQTVLLPRDNQTLTDDQVFALSPMMPRMKARFDSGELAPVLNVGPLLAPITKAQFETGNLQSYPRPAKLFSHNDQQSTWQAFQPEGAQTGWGGLLGDVALSGNTNGMFTAINASGNAVFLNGRNVTSYRITGAGAAKMYGIGGRLYGSAGASEALEKIMRHQSGHVLENDYAMMNARSIEYSSFIDDALGSAPEETRFATDNSLAGQLSIVARLIASRQRLGVTRQVFMVSQGGYDTHSDLKSRHGALLGTLDTALEKFYSVLSSLGLQNAVTTFTASDFGRTLTSNGNGSDHGWGGHHLVLGGSVNGGRFFGNAPHVSITSDDQVGRGRLLPSIAVDQYAATLAQWFGVRESDLAYIAPNIGRFSSTNLGFMESNTPQ